MLKNKEAVTVALDWDMIAKCRYYLIAYIWELDNDISREREMSEPVTPSTIGRQAQINSLSWVRYRYEFGKKSKLLLYIAIIALFSTAVKRQNSNVLDLLLIRGNQSLHQLFQSHSFPLKS